MIDIDKLHEESLNLLEEEQCHFPPQISVKEAKGCYLYEENGNKILDMTSNMEYQPLGYGLIQQQTGCFYEGSGLFSSVQADRLSQLLKKHTRSEQILYFISTNDAKKSAVEIVNNYCLSNDKNKILVSSPSFEPAGEIKTEKVPLNNISVLKTVFTKSVGAIYIEPVQLSGLVNLAEKEYLESVKNICEKNNALMIVDVSNISPLRLGKDIFNYCSSLEPDIVILPGGLSNGVPFGAVAISKKLLDFATAARQGASAFAYEQAIKFVEDYENSALKDVVGQNSKYLEKALNELTYTHFSIADVIADGMLISLLLDVDAYKLAQALFDNDVLVKPVNENTILISPQYNIGKEEVDLLVDALDKSLNKIAKFGKLK